MRNTALLIDRNVAHSVLDCGLTCAEPDVSPEKSGGRGLIDKPGRCAKGALAI